MMEGEIKNLTQLLFSIIFSLSYSYFIPSKLKNPISRLISLLPVLSFFTISPIYLSSPFLRAVTAFFITWLANFKLLLFAFNQGPLSQSNSLSIFIISAALPIRAKQQIKPIKKIKKLPLNLGTEIVVSSILIGLTSKYREELNPKILLIIYCLLVFFMVEILVALSSFLVRALFGLDLDPPSDEPYLSKSLQEFWGRRWNLTVTNTLRQTVYEPIRSVSETLIGNKWAPLPAVLTTFIVSGLMHELLFYYVTWAKPSWEMTNFFVVNGVFVVLEVEIKKAIKGRFGELEFLPWVVSGPSTVGFVVLTSFWLFFPPIVRNGADVMVLEEFRVFCEFVKNEIVRIFSPFLVGYNLSL